MFIWCKRKLKLERTHKEVFRVNFLMLGEIEVLLGHEYSLCSGSVEISPAIQRSNEPRKRYSWIFLRSAFGISLDLSVQISILK